MILPEAAPWFFQQPSKPFVLYWKPVPYTIHAASRQADNKTHVEQNNRQQAIHCLIWETCLAHVLRPTKHGIKFTSHIFHTPRHLLWGKKRVIAYKSVFVTIQDAFFGQFIEIDWWQLVFFALKATKRVGKRATKCSAGCCLFFFTNRNKLKGRLISVLLAT